MTEVPPYYVPKEPGRWRALMLAAAVHAGLLALLWFGVSWNNEVPIAVEAEVWSPQVREAAPKPQPQPVPDPAPEPKPEVRQPPKPEPVETPLAKPEIALEQEKKRKEKEQKLREEAEQQARLRAEKERLAKEQADKAKAEEMAQKQREEKAKADALAKKQREEQIKKAEAEKKRREQEQEEQRMAKLREEEMRRITGAIAGNGDAAQSQGPRGNADYVNRIAAKIRNNTIFNVPEYLANNPAVEYAVELLPDGSIRGQVRKLKSSGIPGFDEAVLNAIEKSQPFPPDKSGKVPSSFNIVHRPKDQ